MIPYHVTFGMPEWIAEGIRTNLYEVVGGVVRLVEGKQVVMWLRPAFEEIAKVGVGTAPLGLLPAGAALSLAVTASVAVIAVAGFAYLAHRHTQTERRLDRIMDEIGLLRLGIDTVIANQVDEVQHKMEAAIETLRIEEEQGRFDAFQPPLMALRECGKFYMAQIERLLRHDCPLAVSPVFLELARLHLLASQAKARGSVLYLSDWSEAEAEAARDQQAFAASRTMLLAPLRDPSRHLTTFVQLTEEEDARMREALPALHRPESYLLPRIEGLTRDPALLRALNAVAAPRAGEPVAGIIPASMAPAGWVPETA